MTNSLNRDALIVPLNEREEIVIASDNSGSIGMKLLDDVTVSYDIVSYYTFRVAYMECVAEGGIPFSIVLQNFNGDAVWELLLQGIRRGFKEIGIDDIPITGSTESNFQLKQSAISMTVLGKRFRRDKETTIDPHNCYVAVIGKPLVGNEVIDYNEEIAPLHLFQWFSEQEEVITILPVGSKGILNELKKVWPNDYYPFISKLDVGKTSGPATCFIVIYVKEFHEKVVKKAGRWLHL